MPPIDHPIGNYFILSAAPIAKGVWVCQATRGRTGKGKIAYSILVRAHEDNFWVCGEVIPIHNGWHKGMWKATLRVFRLADHSDHIDAYFKDNLRAESFMVRTAPEFFA